MNIEQETDQAVCQHCLKTHWGECGGSWMLMFLAETSGGNGANGICIVGILLHATSRFVGYRELFYQLITDVDFKPEMAMGCLSVLINVEKYPFSRNIVSRRISSWHGQRPRPTGFLVVCSLRVAPKQRNNMYLDLTPMV